MASENEVRLQLKGGRSIKIIRTETPTGGMWSIPEMPEIAAHQNISVIRDRLRGKGLIASRPGAKAVFAETEPMNQFKVGQVVKVKVATGVVKGTVVRRIYDSLTGGERYLVEMPSQIQRGKMQAIAVFPYQIRASRPGAKATFKVEDRFYFGKGRKERFADDAKQIAQTILAQLGGGRFVAMTGAKNLAFYNNPPGLRMSIGRGAKDAIKYLRVDYDRGSDTYTMIFSNKSGSTVKSVNHVYADSLQRVFTSTTGFDTHL